MKSTLERVAREAGGRIVAALAARYRDLDIAEEAFAEACVRAAEAWPRSGEPSDGAAWLYRTADRCALDQLRRRGTASRLAPEPPAPLPTPEDVMADDSRLIPDERLRLIFVALLMAGLDGIENRLHPGQPLDKNLYDLPPREQKKVPEVCGSLREALDALDKDRAFLKKGGVMDDDFIDAYIELKMEEVMRLQLHPHPVEFDMYFKC